MGRTTTWSTHAELPQNRNRPEKRRELVRPRESEGFQAAKNGRLVLSQSKR